MMGRRFACIRQTELIFHFLESNPDQTLNPLKRALIEKAGYENGFENICTVEDSLVVLGSARHQAKAAICLNDNGDDFMVAMTSISTKQLSNELLRSFANLNFNNDRFKVTSLQELSALLKRSSELAQALPNQAVIQYKLQVDKALAEIPAELITGTEIERIVKQRIGQDTFRHAMLDYWGGACAVTGISVPEVLRASHAKPWAECESDAERLDVFNGFLLCANLDALFDRFMISFDGTGALLVSPEITDKQISELGLNQSLSLRWLASEHKIYLDYHRNIFEKIE